ncbi:YjbF family lipoprotein [Aliiruegeria lutimaris]|uniref:Group 4 capsule polysaccharide lipoprotein gfcB, YjbF n=1 Tax=Aliiruegeria lutimaris TaxID=571298 RepID=A0A1G9DVU8_9RHOB|nr:YjbF family lipoprotein [Aliiruegeria lutimaris]SDK67930.1 Group 4 capsule polysaccharide lipoprotein gfcB, YjbF [Aliiruegeria lutimaris]
MRSTWHILALAALVLGSSGCGTGFRSLTGAQELGGQAGTPHSEAPQIAAILESRDGGAVLRQVARNGDVTTWRSAGGDTLSLEDGIIVATQSLTPDILSVEGLFPSRWRSMARPLETTRLHRHVDGEEKVVIRGYQCEISQGVSDIVTIAGKSRPVSRTDESCFNADQSFTNSYWLDNSGELVQSRQWLGDDLGYIRLQHRYP